MFIRKTEIKRVLCHLTSRLAFRFAKHTLLLKLCTTSTITFHNLWDPPSLILQAIRSSAPSLPSTLLESECTDSVLGGEDRFLIANQVHSSIRLTHLHSPVGPLVAIDWCIQ